MPDSIGPAGANIIGKCPNFIAPINMPGTILSHTPSKIAPSNILCESAIAVLCAMFSREKRLSSIPGCDCVTPSHIAATPPANCEDAPASESVRLMSGGKFTKGWCAESMSLYAETMAIFSPFICTKLAFSCAEHGAIACAKLLQPKCFLSTTVL